MAKFEIEWEAPEFEYHDKDVSWYWLSIMIAGIIVGFSVWTRNFLFGCFVVIAEILLIVWGNRSPRMVKFKLDDGSFMIDDGAKIYMMKEWESWSVDTLPDEWTSMNFNFRSRLKIPLTVIAPVAKMDQIRTNLKTVLKEVEHKPTFLDAIEKLLRF